MLRGIVAVGMAAFALSAGAAQAATPIAGFEEEIVGNVTYGVGMDIAPDGRIFVAGKKGLLQVILPNGTTRTVLDISSRVNSTIDRGLTGVAVDIAFAQNRYVYLLYTYEPTGQALSGPKTSRLTRIQVNPDNTVVNPANPETVILGKHQPNLLSEACPAPANNVDCIPADGTSHVAGTVRSAPDGTLFVGTGDARYNATNSPDPFRTFDTASYAGKIMRIDRDGRGVPGHPFCPATTDLTQVCTKLYAIGFRNPFRFDFASRGGLWAGDVGEARMEELDHVVPGGNYGWPCYEGTERFAPRANAAQCTSLYAAEGTAGGAKAPAFTYGHDPDVGAVIISGPEYQGNAYPGYKGSVFFGDIDRGFLDRVSFAADGTPSRFDFADSFFGVDMRVGADGLLYSANFNTVSRFKPVVGNRAPVARATADPGAGPAPLSVTLSGAGSTDPDGDVLTYSWDFGDGSPAQTGVTRTHVYAAGTYEATLTVRDPDGRTDTDTVQIRSGVTKPSLSVSGPATYRAGEPVQLTAQAADGAGRNLSAQVEWNVGLRHNEHTHVLADTRGASVSFTPPRDHDTDAHFEVTASVTDADELTTAKTVRLDGETAPVSITVTPANAVGTFSYGGNAFSWPLNRRSVIGFRTILAAPATITSDGTKMVWNKWSNNLPASHEVTVPPSGYSVSATYAPDPWPPETTITNAQAVYTTKTPAFTFTASEPAGKFECRVDGQAWRTCASPWTTPSLTGGSHTVEVRAYDWIGNVDASPARHSFMIVA